MPSQLRSEQKTIEQFMGDRRNIFLIPDYQRPYSWEEDECLTLWDDIFSFAFPDGNRDNFNEQDQYFLGVLIVFMNDSGQLEVIDGQQRLVTLMLLLRALYKACGDNMQDNESRSIKNDIEKCLWKAPERGRDVNFSEIKIFSEVAAEEDKNQFASIMLTGEAPSDFMSRYALNYRLFQKKIQEFHDNYPYYLQQMTDRIILNCSMLPIEAEGRNSAENQDTALRIFSTLNDRGKPLSDSDIFKSKLYKAYSDHGQKDFFVSQWKYFEDTCRKIIVTGKSNPVDDIFMRYMYCVRSEHGIRDTTVEKLRNFYSRDSEKFSLLRRDYDKTFRDLVTLAEFWRDVSIQDEARFSDKILKQLFILHYVPHTMWTFLVSVYFMKYKDSRGMLEEQKFYIFLRKITAFIISARIMLQGNSTPFFIEMVNIAHGRRVTFEQYKFKTDELRSRLKSYDFNDSRKITRAMIAWRVFQTEGQELLSLGDRFDTEHIFPRRRRDEEEISSKNFDSLGNKSLLEKEINIRASDYKFTDKKKYYLGFALENGRIKPGTKIHELAELAKSKDDFTEADIEQRNRNIIEGFISFVEENELTR